MAKESRQQCRLSLLYMAFIISILWIMAQKTSKNRLPIQEKSVLLHRVSLIRPAPSEIPQDRNVARVGGRSGAI